MCYQSSLKSKANIQEVLDSEAHETVTSLDPSKKSLVDYEEYCRTELPRVFKNSLEKITQGPQDSERSMQSKLTDLIQDCQDRVFSSFHTKMVDTNRAKEHGKAHRSESRRIMSAENDQGEKVFEKYNESRNYC
jgi:hypothetical protein